MDFLAKKEHAKLLLESHEIVMLVTITMYVTQAVCLGIHPCIHVNLPKYEDRCQYRVRPETDVPAGYRNGAKIQFRYNRKRNAVSLFRFQLIQTGF